MAAMVVKLVIRIGRSRRLAPSNAASRAVIPAAADATAAGTPSGPRRRLCSANVTSRMALAVAIPTAMIAPMNDWMFSVEPVSHSINTTPATTAGAVDTDTKASRND